MRPKLALALKAAVSLGILAWLVMQIDVTAAVAAMTRLRPEYFVLGLIILLCQYPLGALRWYVIGRAAGGHLPWRDTLRFLLVGIFFNQVLPSAVGGDGVRAWLAARQGIGWTKALSTVFLDRAAALVAMILLVASTLPVISQRTTVAETGQHLILLLGAGAAVVLGLLLAGPTGRILERWRPTRALGNVAQDTGVLWQAGWWSLAILALSVAILTLTALSVWVLAQGMRIEIGFIELLPLILLVLLAMALPVSIAGWGVREGAMVITFGFAGVAAPDTLALSVLWGLVTLAGAMTGGVVWVASRVRERARTKTP